MHDQTVSKTSTTFAVAALLGMALVASAPTADATALEASAKACPPYGSPLTGSPGKACVRPPVPVGDVWQQAMAAVAEATGLLPPVHPEAALAFVDGYSGFVLDCAADGDHPCLLGDPSQPCSPPLRHIECVATNAQECGIGTDPYCVFMSDGECDMVAEFAQCMADSAAWFAGVAADYSMEVALSVGGQCGDPQFPTCPDPPNCQVGLAGACMKTETWANAYDCKADQCPRGSISHCGNPQGLCQNGGGRVGAVNKASPALVEIVVTFEQYVFYDSCIILLVPDNCSASGIKYQAIPGNGGCATALSKMTAPNAPLDQVSRTCLIPH